MDWQTILAIFLAVSLNSFFFFLFSGNKKSDQPGKKQQSRLVVDRQLLIRRLSFLFIVISTTGFFVYLIKFSPQKEKVKIDQESSASIEKETTENAAKYEYPQKYYPNGVNFVFFADEYSSWDEFSKDVDNLILGLKTIEPFKSFERINVYKIKPGEGAGLCSIKTENERKPALRCDGNINDYLIALKLSSFKLVVLSRQDFQSWANIVRMDDSGIFFSVPRKIEGPDGSAFVYLLAHLVGHSFGLKDEEKYVLAKSGGAPHTPDGPNCAPNKEAAEKMWGDLVKDGSDVGYYNTCCGKDEYIKPMQASLMNFNDMSKFNPSFGPVSERYLNKVLKYCYSEIGYSYDDDKEFFDQYPDFKKCIKE